MGEHCALATAMLVAKGERMPMQGHGLPNVSLAAEPFGVIAGFGDVLARVSVATRNMWREFGGDDQPHTFLLLLTMK